MQPVQCLPLTTCFSPLCVLTLPPTITQQLSCNARTTKILITLGHSVAGIKGYLYPGNYWLYTISCTKKSIVLDKNCIATKYIYVIFILEIEIFIVQQGYELFILKNIYFYER